jgi:hypothetical protein
MMISEDDFYKSPNNKEEFKNKLSVLLETNINTQAEEAKRSLKTNLYLQHCANTAYKVLDQQQEEIDNLEQVNEYLIKENDEYKNKFGPLDVETLKKLEQNRQLVPLSQTSRSKKIFAKLQKADKELREEQSKQKQPPKQKS